MASITLTDPVAGTVATAGQQSANNAALRTAVNGGLDNTNMAAAAGVVGSKLLPARISATVGGLGAAVDGAFGQIRAGSTPFGFIPVVYDATYGKWVSPPTHFSNADTTAETTASTVYVDVAQVRIYVAGFKALYDAGLRPFVRLAGALTNSTGGDGVSVKALVNEFNDGDTAAPAIANAATTDPTMTMVGTTYQFKASDYVGFGAWATAPAKTHGQIGMQFKAVTGGTASLQQHSMSLRWEG